MRLRHAHLKMPVLLTAAYLVVWMVCLSDWMWLQQLRWVYRGPGNIDFNLVHIPTFFSGVLAAMAWAGWATLRGRSDVVRYAVLTGCYVIWWHAIVFVGKVFYWETFLAYSSRTLLAAFFLIGLIWVVWGIEAAARRYRHDPEPSLGPDLDRAVTRLFLWTLLFPIGLFWWPRTRPRPVRQTGAWLIVPGYFQLLLFPHYCKEIFGLPRQVPLLSGYWPLIHLGIGLALAGITWGVWQSLRKSRLADCSGPREGQIHRGYSADDDVEYIWNPLHPYAWYYGHQGRKLNQSLSALLSYSFSFWLAFLIFTHIGGCSEIYEMPAGGGEQAQIAQQVKVQKIIKKKFVLNPFSAINFKVPPIDEVKLQLTEITKHAYKVGQGEGDGAGFAAGTKLGKVRFIRLEYTGGDWNEGFGIGSDLNMLIEYGVRTSHPVADRTESRTVLALRNFPVGKSPPMVYLTGQENISLSSTEIKVLQEYLGEKHGMLFVDNGGSRHFHNQVLAMMNKVLPTVSPVQVPRDDVIHRIPYPMPYLPMVAPHGGTEALGWKVDGRWVCYYHPGDIGDAWTDDHSGVDPAIYELCYQLGTNIIFYAHSEYSKWIQAREKSK